jgi:amino acid transporter
MHVQRIEVRIVPDTTETRPGLRRSLSVWQAVGLSVALMAPSMAANINPQQTASAAGRAVPLAFLLAAIGVFLVTYGFVRMCQYYQHAGSVYAFVGATLGPRAGVVSSIGLLGTYTFYAVVTASAAGTLGTAFLTQAGIWPNPPSWGPFVLVAVALVGMAARDRAGQARHRPRADGRGRHDRPHPADHRDHRGPADLRFGTPRWPFHPPGVQLYPGCRPVRGVSRRSVRIPVFRHFEAAATLGEETSEPRRNIPRAILGTAIFGGVYFVVVTAFEMMAFCSDATAFHDSPSLLGDLGTSYVGSWVGDVISLGAAISAFGCCLACVVGGSRLLYALGRDAMGGRGIGRTTAQGAPAVAATVVAGLAALIIVVCAALFGATASDTFAWSGSIGTLILLVIYMLTTVGSIMLVFVRRRITVPAWQIVIPVGALVLLGYTVYVNVIPYPASGPARWFPVAGAGVLLLAIVVVIAAPAYTRRVGERLSIAQTPGIAETTA